MLRRLGIRGKVLAALSVPVLVLFLLAGALSWQSVRQAQTSPCVTSAPAGPTARRGPPPTGTARAQARRGPRGPFPGCPTCEAWCLLHCATVRICRTTCWIPTGTHVERRRWISIGADPARH